jgi:hypothetical protein
MHNVHKFVAFATLQLYRKPDYCIDCDSRTKKNQFEEMDFIESLSDISRGQEGEVIRDYTPLEGVPWR